MIIARAYQSRNGEHKAGNAVRKDHVHHVRWIKVALGFGNYQAGTHGQGREHLGEEQNTIWVMAQHQVPVYRAIEANAIQADLQNVRIEADGVAKHDLVLLGCSTEIESDVLESSERSKYDGTHLYSTYLDCTYQLAKATDPSAPCEQPFLPWGAQWIRK